MAALTRAESKYMYSWWWDSHISPKNSKWLQENLADTDAKVKQMIKLVEVDEDSFARRAEMYYKKRPELMKLIEEFYRAYRALAERYDHATGVIKQAHKTMAEVFPNQVPLDASDDGCLSCIDDSGPHTPETSVPIRAFHDLDEFHYAGRNGALGSEEARCFSKLAEGKARKSLNFHDVDEKEVQVLKNEGYTEKAPVLSESERLGRSETDIQALKEALARLEAEKQAGLLEYQESLRRLSKLESEVLRAQEDSSGLHERASKAEAQVQCLKESLAKLEGEREASLQQYQQCLDRISNLEVNVSCAREDAERLNKQVSKAEKEALILREELLQLNAEKEVCLAKYMEALEKIANLENKLLLAEEKAMMTSERACNAEQEVAALMEAFDRATEEKEAASLQCQKCLDKVASLESQITLSNEEAARLQNEVDQGAAKLKIAEEQCLLLERSNKSKQGEIDSFLNKLGVQNQELSEKQKELERLWTRAQEERLRFTEAETALRTLQSLHCQTQDELTSAAAELQKRVQLMKDMDIQGQRLRDEVRKIRDENKSLSELNLSSAVSIKKMQDEILNLKEGKDNLEGDLELGLVERNALQQEIYCLEKELNSVNKSYQDMVEHVRLMGFQPDSVGSSVKDLQNENTKLKESCQRSKAEISALSEKLAMMEKLTKNKAVLEHCLTKLSAELEDAGEKVKALEESYQLLMKEKFVVIAEKATLISQLEIITENLECVTARNTCLDNSLFHANEELEALRKQSNNLEDSRRVLNNDKSILLNERQALEIKLEAAQQRLEKMGKRHEELEKKYIAVEGQRESALELVDSLCSSLAAEKQEQEASAQLRGIRMAEMENKIHNLQEVDESTRGQLEEELDKAVNSQLEIFILRNIMHDLKETNSSLISKFEKLLHSLSEKLILELEFENIEQQEEENFLSEQIKTLRIGMFHLLKVLDVDLELAYEGNLVEDQIVLHRILIKLDDMKSALCKAWDENQKLVVEKLVFETLHEQLKEEVTDLKVLINTLQQEFKNGHNQLSSLHKDMPKLLQSHEELILRVTEGNRKENVLADEVNNLRAKLLKMQGVSQNLEKENCRILGEKRSLMKSVLQLDAEKRKLEYENSCLVSEMVTLDTLSLIFKNHVLESSEVINQFAQNTGELYDDNSVLEDKVRIMKSMLDKYQMENLNLKDSLRKSDDELEKVGITNSQLMLELASEREELSQKEMELLEAVMVQDDQAKQIAKLLEMYNQQLEENEYLRESKQNGDAEIHRILMKQKQTEKMVEMLHSELEKGKGEAKLWETVSGSFFVELQTSSVREALFREKLSELTKEYECLEAENFSKGLEFVQLKETFESLEGENRQVKAQLAQLTPVLASLRNSVASLESYAMHTESEDDYYKDTANSHRADRDEEFLTASDELSELQDIAFRMKAVEKKVMEMKKPSQERSFKSLKSRSSRSRRGSNRSSRRFLLEFTEEQPAKENHHHQKHTSYPYEAGELIMKDITMLDQASKTSSRGKNRRVGYKNNSESDEQIFGLWETADQTRSIDLTVELAQKETNRIDHRHHCSESVLESDKLEIENNNTKILESLTSDVQRLANLQITVQDLKQKVVITESSNPTKAKGTEYVRVKEQLHETDRAIAKLLDINAKLMKKLEASSPSSSVLSSIADSPEVGGGVSKRRTNVSEQARRCSQKIGRLQLEVQKIQFLLLNLDGSSSNNKMGRANGTRMPERNSKILLKDFLYVRTRTPRRRKAHFCGCVHPPTSGD